jgi:ribosomal protein S18 acetylase RimI-like enzyme
MDNKEFIIEEVTAFSPELYESIVKLAKQLGHNYKELTKEDFIGILESACTTLLVAREVKTNTIVGMVTLLVFRIPYVKKGYLDDLSVDEAYRGHGLGRKLMEASIAFFKDSGVAYADCTSRPRREASNNLYEKVGFQKRETNVYRIVFSYGEV